MRRSDPSQWVVCQTCQQRFEYGNLQTYGGLPGNLLSAALDNRGIVRAGAAILFVVREIILYYLKIVPIIPFLSMQGFLYISKGLMLRFLTSRLLWNMVRQIRMIFLLLYICHRCLCTVSAVVQSHSFTSCSLVLGGENIADIFVGNVFRC